MVGLNEKGKIGKAYSRHEINVDRSKWSTMSTWRNSGGVEVLHHGPTVWTAHSHLFGNFLDAVMHSSSVVALRMCRNMYRIECSCIEKNVLPACRMFMYHTRSVTCGMWSPTQSLMRPSQRSA